MADEVVVDALPYIDHGYDDPGVRSLSCFVVFNFVTWYVIICDVPDAPGSTLTQQSTRYRYACFLAEQPWHCVTKNFFSSSVPDPCILVRIRIRGSVPRTEETESCSFHQRLRYCADQPYIFSWPMVISNSVNEFFVAV
jgi:hypothetical protein